MKRNGLEKMEISISKKNIEMKNMKFISTMHVLE